MTDEAKRCVEALKYCEDTGARCGGCPSGVDEKGVPICQSQAHIGWMYRTGWSCRKDRRRNDMEIRPITFRQACDFINNHHRHHHSTVGCKFCIGLYDEDRMVGCAVVGRPVSRHLDDGLTCEINRLCTDGTKNACSMLYGASCRVAKEMGYKRVITYILESENGASLKASNFFCEGSAGGTHWTGTRNRG